MNDKINIDNSLNAFDRKAKTMLENHQLPVDESIWNEIEAKMQQRKRIAIPFWFWLSGGAAAVVALLFMLRPLAESGKSVSIASNIQKTKTETILHPKTFKTLISPSAKGQQQIQQTTNNKLSKDKTIYKSNGNPIIEPKIQTDSIATVIVESKENNQSSTSENTITTNIQEQKNNKTDLLASNLPTENQEKKTKKSAKSSGWQIAATYGSSNEAPTSANGQLFATNARLDNTLLSNVSTYNAKNDIVNIIRKSYSTPVSVGLLVRKNINESIALESGLVYTFLKNKLSNNIQLTPDNQLNLHYLGLPVNLVFKIIDSKKWEIYLSGGGIAEKGIRSEYTVYSLSGSQSNKTVVVSAIDGFQWSISGALGATYKINQQFGLFFEPKLAYYFNNNQPTSIRTDQPTTLGITGGLRYTFR